MQHDDLRETSSRAREATPPPVATPPPAPEAVPPPRAATGPARPRAAHQAPPSSASVPPLTPPPYVPPIIVNVATGGEKKGLLRRIIEGLVTGWMVRIALSLFFFGMPAWIPLILAWFGYERGDSIKQALAAAKKHAEDAIHAAEEKARRAAEEATERARKLADKASDVKESVTGKIDTAKQAVSFASIFKPSLPSRPSRPSFSRRDDAAQERAERDEARGRPYRGRWNPTELAPPIPPPGQEQYLRDKPIWDRNEALMKQIDSKHFWDANCEAVVDHHQFDLESHVYSGQFAFYYHKDCQICDANKRLAKEVYTLCQQHPESMAGWKVDFAKWANGFMENTSITGVRAKVKGLLASRDEAHAAKVVDEAYQRLRQGLSVDAYDSETRVFTGKGTYYFEKDCERCAYARRVAQDIYAIYQQHPEPLAEWAAGLEQKTQELNRASHSKPQRHP